MNHIWLALAIVANLISTPQPFVVRFARAMNGETVVVSIDGGPAETTFAGKMLFQDQNRSWSSVCADVRSPVTAGQFFTVRAISTSKAGGNYVLAGKIVAKYFKIATTPAQCAGLQLAVWKAIEDGGKTADFTTGNFQARAADQVIVYAEQFYDSFDEQDDAILLQAQGGGGGDDGGGGGQGQLSPGGS